MACFGMADTKMKKVLFFTNMPSPYRVSFFNLLGKHCDLHVMFELGKAKGRDQTWLSNRFESFTPHFLKSHAYSNEGSFAFDVIRQFKKISPDISIICDISSLSGVRLLSYLIHHHKPYIIEGDGAFDRPCNFIKRKLKQKFFMNAEKLLYTSEEHRNYYLRFWAAKEQLFWYPFSSVSRGDILGENEILKRMEKPISSPFVFLSVGRFLDWKNFETAIRAFGKACVRNSKLIIVGGEPTPEYLRIIEEENINNVEFLPFMDSKKLYRLMQQCDCFVFPSLNDIWGLVINEAAANGMPIISSRGALSAVEMQQNTDGIVLYDGLDVDDLATKMQTIVSLSKGDLLKMSLNNLRAVNNYTIEAMTKKHMELLELK